MEKVVKMLLSLSGEKFIYEMMIGFLEMIFICFDLFKMKMDFGFILMLILWVYGLVLSCIW